MPRRPFVCRCRRCSRSRRASIAWQLAFQSYTHHCCRQPRTWRHRVQRSPRPPPFPSLCVKRCGTASLVVAPDRWPSNIAHHIQSRGGRLAAMTHPIALIFADRLRTFIRGPRPAQSSITWIPKLPLSLHIGNTRVSGSPIAIVAASGRFPKLISRMPFVLLWN